MNREKLLQPNNKEKVYIPNEIFTDFTKNEQISSKNIGFLYTYYCVITYLYRYCKYSTGEFINNEMIKQILGYAKENKKIDYLIKKDGVLDQMGYTKTIKDFPIGYRLDSQYIEFDMYSELDRETRKLIPMPKNYHIKYPVKAFYRYEDNIYDGTFYDIANTHLFDVQLFIKMMDDDISASEYFIFQLLTHKNDMYRNGYSIGLKQLNREINISERTLIRYIDKLEQNGYIKIVREECKAANTKANTYIIQKSKT